MSSHNQIHRARQGREALLYVGGRYFENTAVNQIINMALASDLIIQLPTCSQFNSRVDFESTSNPQWILRSVSETSSLIFQPTTSVPSRTHLTQENVRSTIAVLYTRQVHFFVKTFKNVTKTGPKSGSLERLYYFLIQFYEGGFSKPVKAYKIKGSKTQKNFDVSTPKYPFDKK